MSMLAYRWAKQVRGLSSSEKFVLVILADYYNDGPKRAWPAIATLAADTCMSPSTIKRAIKRLTDQGLIEVERWFDNNSGQQMSNRYCLPLYDPTSRASSKPLYAEYGRDSLMAGDDGSTFSEYAYTRGS